MKGTNVGFQSGTHQFVTQFDTTDMEEIKKLWWEFSIDEGIITYVEEAEILDD